MRLATAFTILLYIAISACAFRHYDQDSGVEHIWGIGHFTQKTQVSSSRQEGVFRGVELVGVSFGKSSGGPYFTIGWDSRQELQVLSPDTAMQVAAPPRELSKFHLIPEWSNMTSIKKE